MYHEKQYKNYCRCHALNNLFGRKIVSYPQFDKHCDNFDKKNGFSSGFSRSKFGFYNFGGTNNIFGYVLKNSGINIKMIHYDYYKSKNINKVSSDKTIGFIVYNRNHTYCMRYNKNAKKGYIIDSLQSKIREVTNFNIFRRKGLGVIEVIQC